MSDTEDGHYVIIARAGAWQVECQDGACWLFNTQTGTDIPSRFGTEAGALYFLQHILKVPPAQVQRLIDTAPTEEQ